MTALSYISIQHVVNKVTQKGKLSNLLGGAMAKSKYFIKAELWADVKDTNESSFVIIYNFGCEGNTQHKVSFSSCADK